MHLVTDNVPFALCGLERADAPVAVWDPREAAREFCVECGRRLRKQTELAESALAVALAKRGLVPEDEYERTCSEAKDELQELTRMFPAGQLMDHVTYARTCLARNDPKDAHAAVVRWREIVHELGLIA